MQKTVKNYASAPRLLAGIIANSIALKIGTRSDLPMAYADITFTDCQNKQNKNEQYFDKVISQIADVKVAN